MRVAVNIELPEADRKKLERWATSRSVAVPLRERSRIMLRASEGLTNKEIARELGIDTNKVSRWRGRYADEGLEGIEKERPWGGNHGGKDSRAQAELEEQGDQADDAARAGGGDALVVALAGPGVGELSRAIHPLANRIDAESLSAGEGLS